MDFKKAMGANIIKMIVVDTYSSEKEWIRVWFCVVRH